MHAPERLVRPFTSPDWIYEIKHDGYRCLAGIEPGEPGDTARVQLRTKSGANATGWYPEVVRALACIPGGPHVIDGEAAVLGEHGVSDFNRLHRRSLHRRWYAGAPQVTYCAFDLLVVNGQDVMALPLVERKARLEELLHPCERRAVMFIGDLPADATIFQAMLGAGLKIEGVVAKRKASPYRPGVRSDDWLKIKRPDWQEGRIWRK
jgi:bifunctional non-homologous end joining protein LigD